MLKPETIDRFRVKPGTKVKLKHYSTDSVDDNPAVGEGQQMAKESATALLAENRANLDAAQELLYASNSRAVLLIFQAMDAAGKDGTIRHVMSGVNPQGCQVFSFKQPSAEELDHNFLWRYSKALPELGRIGIFNRSYYEDVLVVKVHPEWIDTAQLGNPDNKFWKKRYEDINNFEKHISRNGTLVLKFYLHISKEEQRKRFLARLDDPNKQWKFSEGDLAERDRWKDYQRAFEKAINATSTKNAPWHIIPADHKPVARALVADIIVSAIRGLNLQYPQISPAQKEKLAAAKAKLEAEPSKPDADDSKGDA